MLTLVLINGLGELVDGGWNLETLEKNALLSLDANVLGPFDETAQIPLGLDVLTNAKVTRTFLKEGVDDPLRFGLLDSQRGCCHLLALLSLSLKITLSDLSQVITYYFIILIFIKAVKKRCTLKLKKDN